MDFEIFTMVPTWVHPKQQHYVVSMWMWEWGSEPEKITIFCHMVMDENFR